MSHYFSLDSLRLMRSSCLQVWLPTVQLVLQADWQLDWHSPQPIISDFLSGLAMVLICFISNSSKLNVLVNYTLFLIKLQAFFIIIYAEVL